MTAAALAVPVVEAETAAWAVPVAEASEALVEALVAEALEALVEKAPEAADLVEEAPVKVVLAAAG